MYPQECWGLRTHRLPPDSEALRDLRNWLREEYASGGEAPDRAEGVQEFTEGESGNSKRGEEGGSTSPAAPLAGLPHSGKGHRKQKPGAPWPGKGKVHPPVGQRSAVARALAHFEESNIPIVVDTTSGGLSVHGVEWRNRYLAIAQKRGIALQVWEEPNSFTGVGRKSAHARRIWLFQLQASGKAFGVRSAELEGEDVRGVALTLGIRDQRRLDLDVLHSENVLHLQLLGARNLPLETNADGHVCFYAQVPKGYSNPPPLHGALEDMRGIHGGRNDRRPIARGRGDNLSTPHGKLLVETGAEGGGRVHQPGSPGEGKPR